MVVESILTGALVVVMVTRPPTVPAFVFPRWGLCPWLHDHSHRSFPSVQASVGGLSSEMDQSVISNTIE